jgi:hypothetical protein
VKSKNKLAKKKGPENDLGALKRVRGV